MQITIFYVFYVFYVADKKQTDYKTDKKQTDYEAKIRTETQNGSRFSSIIKKGTWVCSSSWISMIHIKQTRFN